MEEIPVYFVASLDFSINPKIRDMAYLINHLIHDSKNPRIIYETKILTNVYMIKKPKLVFFKHLYHFLGGGVGISLL